MMIKLRAKNIYISFVFPKILGGVLRWHILLMTHVSAVELVNQNVLFHA